MVRPIVAREGDGSIPVGLDGKVIAFEDLDLWMKTRDREAREASRSAKPVSYAIPETDWVQWAAVAPGSDLDDLRFLGERLASIYGWPEAQATTFVVTGKQPVVAAIRIRREPREHVDAEGKRLSAASRVVLDIDPTISAEELSRTLRRIQGEMLPDYSRPGAKASLLGSFGHSHRTGTWKERMREWDRLYPDWAYGKDENVGNFQRDVSKYVPRLLDPVGSPRR